MLSAFLTSCQPVLPANYASVVRAAKSAGDALAEYEADTTAPTPIFSACLHWASKDSNTFSWRLYEKHYSRLLTPFWTLWLATNCKLLTAAAL